MKTIINILICVIAFIATTCYAGADYQSALQECAGRFGGQNYSSLYIVTNECRMLPIYCKDYATMVSTGRLFDITYKPNVICNNKYPKIHRKVYHPGDMFLHMANNLAPLKGITLYKYLKERGCTDAEINTHKCSLSAGRKTIEQNTYDLNYQRKRLHTRSYRYVRTAVDFYISMVMSQKYDVGFTLLSNRDIITNMVTWYVVYYFLPEWSTKLEALISDDDIINYISDNINRLVLRAVEEM